MSIKSIIKVINKPVNSFIFGCFVMSAIFYVMPYLIQYI